MFGSVRPVNYPDTLSVGSEELPVEGNIGDQGRTKGFHIGASGAAFWNGIAMPLAREALVFVGVFKSSEIVDVKYRGPVDLKHFSCTNAERSSFIKRVCYDRSNGYMVISLNGIYYHYCEIDHETVASLLKADSMGRFYNSPIKGRFDCRVNRVPNY